MTASTTLFILAKEPIAGLVKTRLCPPCTPEQAADLALAALVDTLAAARGVANARCVLVLEGDVGPWLPEGIEVIAQGDGGLGERLAAAFATASGPAVLIGMDTPQVTTPVLDQVMTELSQPGVDAILGLTEDGGWWIIGFDCAPPGAFHGIPMSTRETGRAQRDRLSTLGLRTAPIATALDVDTFADAEYVARLAPHTEFASAVRAVQRP